MKKLKIAAIAVLLFATTTSCQLAPQKQGKDKRGKRPTPKQLIAHMDANKDGKLSKIEVKGPIKNDFAKIDKNKDGFITLAEIKAMPKPKHRKRQGPPPGQE